MVAPLIRVPKTSQGPIIQPMSVIQYMVSWGFRSMGWRMSWAAFTGKPQWVWTAPLGRPVVPLV